MNRAMVITYEQVRSEMQAYIEASRTQFALKTVASKITSDPMEMGSFGKGGTKGMKGKNGQGDGESVKKGLHQNQSPNSNQDVVHWHCGKKGHLEHRMLVESKESIQLWWNSKRRRPRKTNRQGSRLIGTRRTTCSGGATTATSSCELSRLGVD